MVFISNGKKLHVSAYSGHLQVLTTFLLKEFYIIRLNRVVQSQFPPNPTPTQPERSTPSYLLVHWPNRHPTNLAKQKHVKWWWDFNITSGLGILHKTPGNYPKRNTLYIYKTLLARKLSKPEDGRYRPKHVVFLLLINIITYPYIYSCVFDWIYLTIHSEVTFCMKIYLNYHAWGFLLEKVEK